ncbi:MULTISPECIES: hypothetical protein [Actinoplanes]|uniref:HAAS signaling domain-containing protein n=1 Tax=Actinoplanes TaxID=1865 RepID=UPI000698603C|nr:MULTISPECIES: hypothetical protein [Actinoplanes]GLY02494.1 hypothetical protein Acsp01_28730 [Actinoplanes sp. NBRC 101535]
MTETDHLIEGYLARVELAAAGLPVVRRQELLRDLREHIEIARAESEDGSGAATVAILDRLGEPRDIAAAAEAQDTGRLAAIAAIAAGSGYEGSEAAGRGSDAAFGPAPMTHGPAPVMPAKRGGLPGWGWGLVGGGVLVVLFLLCGAFAFTGAEVNRPVPATTAYLPGGEAEPVEEAPTTTEPTTTAPATDPATVQPTTTGPTPAE